MIPDLSSPEIIKKLEELYGYTDDFYHAGYILPNGKMLNTLPDETGHRCHHTVERFTTREDFVLAGAIRHVIGKNYFEMRTLPTDAQFTVIVEMIRFWSGDIAFDLWKGKEGLDTRRYLIGTHPIVVVKDIREFYK